MSGPLWRLITAVVDFLAQECDEGPGGSRGVALVVWGFEAGATEGLESAVASTGSPKTTVCMAPSAFSEPTG